MSAPPPEQPIYYSPAPNAGAPVDGSQPYQYVAPQNTGAPYQVSPEQQASTLTQPYNYAQSPAPVAQQVYVNPTGQSPQPVYMQQQPGLASPAPQNAYIQQPGYDQTQQFQTQQQPSTFIVTTNTSTEVPQITPSGKGLTGKMPQFDQCCLCFPLHTGALIIAAVMVIYYGYCGINLLAWGAFVGVYITYIIFGILYLMIAVVSGYGFVGIYKENREYVDRFIQMFIIGSIAWFVLEFLHMIILVAAIGSFLWAWWIVNILIAGLLQYYFCICLVSYQRVLHHRLGVDEKI